MTMGFIWFWLVAIMIVAYVVLDGFDLGVGILHPFLARTDEEKQLMLRSIGPVWDGNEVWLLAGGGTLYFAFPLVYASAFSGFYLALMIVLWLLIMRGISVELRMHINVGVWKSLFDGLFFFSSALLALLGVIQFCRRGDDRKAFACSCVYLTVMLVGAAIGLYPRLLPSTTGTRYDITIDQALSGPHTLRVGLAWWAFGMCLAFTYFVIVYRMFRGKVSLEGGGYGH